MQEIKDGVRATVRVGYDGKVHKTFRGHNADERYHHEKRILRFLEKKGCPCVPRVIDHDDEQLKLVMTHCGQPVANLGAERMQEIFAEVERFGVRHTDQALRNITYDARRGQFCVIDFELADLLEEAGALWTTLSWSGITDPGRRRPRNEDMFCCFTLRRGEFSRLPDEGTGQVADGDFVVVISDGMGGARSGDLASSVITGRLREMLPASYRLAANGLYSDRLGLLAECLGEVHQELNDLAERRPHLAGMGATVTLAWFTEDNVYFAHVGDTRLYLFREGVLEQKTEDDTRAWQQFRRGEINERQFKTHPTRHCLKQAIGAGVSRIHPQLGSIALQPGDWFLLCSDGLIGGLWDRQIREILASKTTPSEIMRQMLRESLEADGSDNVTLAVVRVD